MKTIEEQILDAAIGVAIRFFFCEVIGREREVYDVITADYDAAEDEGMYDNVDWVLDQYLPQNDDYDKPVVVWDTFSNKSLEDIQWDIINLVDDMCHSFDFTGDI